MKTRMLLLIAAPFVLMLGSTAQEPTIAVEEAPALPAEATDEGFVSPPSSEGSVVTGPIVSAPATDSHIAVAETCHPIHIVREHMSLSAKRLIRCHGAPVRQTICVKSPVDCCLYAVNACVPQCCVGEPICCGERVGLLGRGYVVYQWPCGYQVEVVFRVHGGAILNYK